MLNGKHLTACETHNCKNKYFKCPESYCLPWRYVCNGKWDCPGGLEEINCNRPSCPGFFKCHKSSICLPTQDLCDDFNDCQDGDDEFFCGYSLKECPITCYCFLLSIKCKNVNICSSCANVVILGWSRTFFGIMDPPYFYLGAS